MLKIRELNWQDADAIYQVLKELPENENGFMNPYHGIDKATFMQETMQKLMDIANGINLKPGHVPQTYYFLWEDEHIVGVYKLRHYLNENLKNGSGHIGYGILPAYRNQGYAKKGLALLIDIAKDIIQEDEIYMASHKDNPASLHVQLANGAYIHHEDEEEVYTRIPIKQIHACIWDLDGTLLDSYEVILDSLQATMRYYGHTYDREYLREYVILKSVHQFIQEFAQKEGLQFEAVYQYYTTLQDAGNDKVKLIKNAKETLLLLQRKGVRNFVYTHKDHTAQDVLESLGIAEYIHYTITGDDGFAKKPNPEGIHHLIEKYKLKPDDCTYVGDRRLDEEAGKNAGIKRILFLDKNTPVTPLYEDTIIVDDLLKIVDLYE